MEYGVGRSYHVSFFHEQL
ncbi:unnamed protein product [Oikopleura dioica]|uniref:Uncharacterized protein n=1 Tax=Oikopleura dioica TaxID=34765 RepID=E4Z299_OIKDI|nr:unnamed protein product [Oikopleura dioica]